MSIVEEHLSESFYNEILKKWFKQDIKVINCDQSYAVEPGENLTCELVRTKITFTKENDNNIHTISMMAKRLMENEVIIKIEQEMDFFKCELNMYGDILPLMEKLEYKKKVAPEIYYLSKEPKRIIIMEDLAASNYVMIDRLEGLNLEHCLLSVERLAYFHAASLLIYEKNPKLITAFNKGLFCNFGLFENLISTTFHETLEVCLRTPDLGKYSAVFTEALREKFFTSTMLDPNFNVLNHGDFWCNNLLFKYDAKGNTEDVVLVDFQGSVFTSPFFDLHYFIVTSPTLDVKEDHIDTILNHYYDSFSRYLEIWNIKTNFMSREGFHKGFCDTIHMGLGAVCSALPFIKGYKGPDANLENFLQHGEEGSFRHYCFRNTRYLTALKCLLTFYERLGAI